MLKSNAFVLRKNNYREYDRIYTLYTADYGKVSLLARGARRIKSKLAPSLENFGEVRVDFANGKVFNHLAGAKTVIKNNRILKDNNKILLAQDLFYLFDRFVKLGDRDAGMFSLLKESLRALDEEKNEENFSKISVYFFWRLTDLLGYRPQLDECALCGRAGGYAVSPPPPFKGEVPEGRRGMRNSNITPSAFGISPSKERERKNLKFNITDNIIICSKCIGEGIFIQENTLDDLKKIFQSGLAEFLHIELDNQLTGITEKAKQIKLSEL